MKLHDWTLLSFFGQIDNAINLNSISMKFFNLESEHKVNHLKIEIINQRNSESRPLWTYISGILYWPVEGEALDITPTIGSSKMF